MKYYLIVILIYMFSQLVKLLDTWILIGMISMFMFFAHFFLLCKCA
jgi:hypothetical protein